MVGLKSQKRERKLRRKDQVSNHTCVPGPHDYGNVQALEAIAACNILSAQKGTMKEQVEIVKLTNEVERLIYENAWLLGKNLEGKSVQEMHELEQQLSDNFVSFQVKKDELLFKELESTNRKIYELDKQIADTSQVLFATSHRSGDQVGNFRDPSDLLQRLDELHLNEKKRKVVEVLFSQPYGSFGNFAMMSFMIRRR
ncbi:hypothetical protein L2E82_29565 [Cichorium intybus]|uniref:Uncharacterized protein n=1 Tax=Cichorium intybus TaxID=13427 RepID=A0ACB9CYA6_CICIN|nr:hypothetical protein L2E82_29565 [Cichorium intybus]